VERLEDEADRLVAQGGHLAGVQRGHVPAADDQAAAGRPVEPAEQVHQR
jgi:hypothetical protein